MKPSFEKQKDWMSRFDSMQGAIDLSRKQVEDHEIRIMRIIKQTG